MTQIVTSRRDRSVPPALIDSDAALPGCPPFGTFRPSRALRGVLSVTRRLPRFWWSRPLASVCRRLAGATLVDSVDVEVFSSRMRLHPSDNLCEKRVLFTPQFFDPEERRFLKKTLRPGSAFVDLGANVGVYSLFVARKCQGDVLILAVEPDPVIHERLRFNVASSGCDAIRIVNAAVTDACGEVELCLDHGNRGRNSIVAESGEAIRVRGVTLRDLLDAHGIERPDCIKLDIEGAEHLVLRKFFEDADASRYPRAVILEQIRRQPLSAAARLLLDYGYRIVETTRMNLILQR